MPPISFMAWRIGDILDIDQQIRWISAHGFDAISLHSSAGTPGKWCGVASEMADASRRAALRQMLGVFRRREVHAPFAAVMQCGETEEALAKLAPVLEFSGEVGADVVTVHAVVPKEDCESDFSAWCRDVAKLDELAARNNVCVGLEVTAGFESIRNLGLPQVGVTLDVGHMFLGNNPAIACFADLGEVVYLLGDTLVHLHLHDVCEGVDHIEVGTGEIDYAPLFEALRGIGYGGMLCLELNPDRVEPEGMVRSRLALEEFWRKAGVEA